MPGSSRMTGSARPSARRRAASVGSTGTKREPVPRRDPRRAQRRRQGRYHRVDHQVRAFRRRQAGRAGRRDRDADEGRFRRRHRLLGCHRRRHRAPRFEQAAHRPGHQAGRGQRRTGCPGQRLERGLRPLRPHRGAGAADRARHLDAGAAHQRPAHAGPAAGVARRSDRQRERHRGHQRDPVRRQRPALGAGGPSGRRRCDDPAVRHRRASTIRILAKRPKTIRRASFPRSPVRTISTE